MCPVSLWYEVEIMKHSLIITFLGIIGILLILVVLLFQEKRKLEARLSNIAGAPKSFEDSSLGIQPQTNVPTPITNSEKFSGKNERFADVPGLSVKTSLKGAAWRAKRDVDEIKELSSLSDEEASSLASALEDSYKRGIPPEERLLMVSEILGSDRAREIQTLREEAERFEEEKELDDRVTILTKALSLSESQKGELRRVLASVAAELGSDRQAIRSSMKEMMALHFDDEAGRDELQHRYDEMKQLSAAYKERRISLITERLSGTLSKDQISKLTALESERIERR